MGNQWSASVTILSILVSSDGFVINTKYGRHTIPFTSSPARITTSELYMKGYMDHMESQQSQQSQNSGNRDNGPPVAFLEDDPYNQIPQQQQQQQHNNNNNNNNSYSQHGTPTLDLLSDNNPNANGFSGTGPLPVADMDKVDSAMRMIEASLMESVDDAISQIEMELKGTASDAIDTIVGQQLFDMGSLNDRLDAELGTSTPAPQVPVPVPSAEEEYLAKVAEANRLSEQQRVQQHQLQQQAQAAKFELQKQQQELMEAREAHKLLIADEERVKQEKLQFQQERAAIEAAAKRKQEEYFSRMQEAARIETQRAAERERLDEQTQELKFEELRKMEEARIAKEEYLARVAEAARLEAERKQEEELRAQQAEAAREGDQLRMEQQLQLEQAAREAALTEQQHRMEEERLAKEAEQLRQQQAEAEEARTAKEGYLLRVAEEARMAEQGDLLTRAAQAKRAALDDALELQQQRQDTNNNANNVEDYLKRVAEAQSHNAARLEEQRVEHEQEQRRLVEECRLEQERLAMEAEAHALDVARLEQERLAKEAELAEERERVHQARSEAQALEAARLEQQLAADEAEQARAAEASRVEEERRTKEEEIAAAAQAAKLESDQKEGEYRVAKEAYLVRRMKEMEAKEDQEDELSEKQAEVLRAAEEAKAEALRLKEEARAKRAQEKKLRVNADAVKAGIKIKDMPPARSHPPMLASEMGLAANEKMAQKNIQEELDSESPLEERLSRMVSSTIEGSLTNQKSKFLDTKNNLKDTKRRTQKRLVRGMYEREKAAERIAELQAKMEHEMNIINFELEEVLTEVQKKIDTEMYRITELFKEAIGGEVNRQTLISNLIGLLCRAVETKEEEITSEMKITADMKGVLGALKEGSISENLRNLVEIREKVCAIDEALLADLHDCVRELELILSDSQERSTLLKSTFEGVTRPEAMTTDQEEWSDSIDHMENVLDIAAVNVEAAENRIQFLKTRIEDALVNKSQVLGEPLPKSFQQRGLPDMEDEQMMPNQEMAQQLQPFHDSEQPNYSLDTLKDMDEMDVLHIMGTSIGNAAVGGTRMALLGLRAVLDSATEDYDHFQDGPVDINAPRPSRRHMSESTSRAAAEARKAAKSLSDAVSAALSLTIKSAEKIGSEIKNDRIKLLPPKPKDDDVEFDRWMD